MRHLSARVGPKNGSIGGSPSPWWNLTKQTAREEGCWSNDMRCRESFFSSQSAQLSGRDANIISTYQNNMAGDIQPFPNESMLKPVS